MKCNYVKRKDVKERRKEIEEVIPKINKDVKKEYERGFNYMVVGTARRNLIVTRGNSAWDIDYQLVFNSTYFKNVIPFELKNFVKEHFEKHLSNKYTVNLSTSVITITSINQKKSFDIAIIKHDFKTNEGEILRGKNNDKKNSNYAKWEKLRKSQNLSEIRKRINGKEDWDDLREIFKKKKCIEMAKEKDIQTSTFSIYLESINELLDKK